MPSPTVAPTHQWRGHNGDESVRAYTEGGGLDPMIEWQMPPSELTALVALLAGACREMWGGFALAVLLPEPRPGGPAVTTRGPLVPDCVRAIDASTVWPSDTGEARGPEVPADS